MKTFIISKILFLTLIIIGCDNTSLEVINEYKNGTVSAILSKEIHNTTVSDVYLVKLKCINSEKEILKASKVNDIKIKWEDGFLVINIKADRIHNFKNYFWCKNIKKMIKIKLISN